MDNMELTKDRSSTKEEIRLRRRAKNKAKKEESKRLREEEMRRKLFEPKDQRVRLVSHKEVETFYNLRTASNSSNLTPLPLLSEEFPNLGSEKPRLKSDKKVTGQLEGKTTDSLTQLAHHEGNRQETANTTGQFQNSSLSIDRSPNQNPTLQESQIAAKNQCVKPKRADPIKIDLQAALEQSKSSGAFDRKPFGSPNTSMKKKATTHLSGNQLDSSNPERKKGKQRENLKPPKPSRLKTIILQDRITRAELKANKVLFNNQDGTDNASETSVVQEDQQTSLRANTASSETNYQVVAANNQLPETEIPPETVASEEVVSAKIEEGFSCIIVSKSEIVPAHTICKENIPGKFETSIFKDDDIKNSLNTSQTSKNTVMDSIHSRKFRGYCDHMLSPELDNAASSLIQDIVKFQDRQYFSDPIKAHAKRRFVLGLRETQKYLKLKKLKLIIIAPDLEQTQSEGGIDDTVMSLKASATSQEVPYVFALNRRELRRLTNKACHVRGVSCIGIISYEGSQDNFLAIQMILPELRSRYQNLTDRRTTPSHAQVEGISMKPEEGADINSQVVASFLVKLTKELENG